MVKWSTDTLKLCLSTEKKCLLTLPVTNMVVLRSVNAAYRTLFVCSKHVYNTCLVFLKLPLCWFSSWQKMFNFCVLDLVHFSQASSTNWCWRDKACCHGDEARHCPPGRHVKASGWPTRAAWAWAARASIAKCVRSTSTRRPSSAR